MLFDISIFYLLMIPFNIFLVVMIVKVTYHRYSARDMPIVDIDFIHNYPSIMITTTYINCSFVGYCYIVIWKEYLMDVFYIIIFE